MSDYRVRTAERKAQANPSLEADACLLKERMRSGELTREHVELAPPLTTAANEPD